MTKTVTIKDTAADAETFVEAVAAGSSVETVHFNQNGKSKFMIIVDDITDLITGVGDGRKTVTTAASREALVGSTTTMKEVTITAETDNTDVIVVGGATVVAALATRQGTPLYPGDSITLRGDDLADIYIDSVVSGEGVTYSYST